MIGAFEAAQGDQERLSILTALRVVVTTKNITPVLDGLKKEYSLQVRTALENIVVSAYRRIPPTASNIKPLIDRLAKAGKGERRSLWRILGTRGGKEVQDKLKKIFDEDDHDKLYLQDAMIALSSLQTPVGLSVMLKAFEKADDDDVIKIVASRGCARRVGLPHNYDIKEWKVQWEIALKMASKGQEWQKIFNSIADYPGPEVLKFLEDKAKDKDMGPFAKNAINQFNQIEKEAEVLEAGQLLVANRQIARADGVLFDSVLQAMEQWSRTEAWFVWHFKMKETGEYKVEVSQSFADANENEFSVIFGKTELKGMTTDTGDWAEYRPNVLKETIKLEANKTYALFLKAGEVVQPRMMNFKGVRLSKK